MSARRRLIQTKGDVQVHADFEGRVGGARDHEAETRRNALYAELRLLTKAELVRRRGVPVMTDYSRQELIAMIVAAQGDNPPDGALAPAGRSCRVLGVNDEQCKQTGGTMDTTTIPTADSLMEGIGKALNPNKAPYARLRVGGKTVGYASARKDGVLLDFAAGSVEKAPAKFQGDLIRKGDRARLGVTAKNERKARALLEWLAKQV